MRYKKTVGKLVNTSEMKVLTVGGTPRERGHAIGESLREDIQVVMEKHEQAIDTRKGYSLGNYYAAFDNFSAHLDAARKWTPDLLEEVWGMAEGANIEWKRMFRYKMMDEDWFFDNYHYASQAKIHCKCTSFGVANQKGLPTYAGQNMDIMSYAEGHQVLLRIQYPDNDLESLVYTCAGTLALCGMNNAPLGVNCNTLMQLGCRPDGLPVAFVARSLLEKASYEEAVNFLGNTTHAVGQNYILSTANRVGSYECSPNKVVEYRPRTDGRRVCHTNHPMINDDTSKFEELNESKSGGSKLGNANSCSRLASIAARTVHRDGMVGLDDLKSALRAKDDPDNPVCRDHSTNIQASVIAYTVGSVIYEYSQKAQLHLASGPPSESEFMTFQFSST